MIEKAKVAGKGTPRKLRWPGEETKNGDAHEVVLVGEAQEIVRRAWANRLPDCDHLFHIDGKPLGAMRSELERTCEALGIPYGRGKGIVFHDTRHSAVTNLVAAGAPEPVAMTITGHADPNVFKRYNVRRDEVQADALAKQSAYLVGQRGTTPRAASLRQKMTHCEGTFLGHVSPCEASASRLSTRLSYCALVAQVDRAPDSSSRARAHPRQLSHAKTLAGEGVQHRTRCGKAGRERQKHGDRDGDRAAGDEGEELRRASTGFSGDGRRRGDRVPGRPPAWYEKRPRPS